MPRCLVMAERLVSESDRTGYLSSLAVRRNAATAASAHFWVFEDAAQRGRFLEFVEAGSDESLRVAVDSTQIGRNRGDIEQSAAIHSDGVIWNEVAVPA